MNCLVLKLVVTFWLTLLVCGCPRNGPKNNGINVKSDKCGTQGGDPNLFGPSICYPAPFDSEIYDEALETGKKHVRGEVTNMSVVNRIRRSKEVSARVAEEWKTGYINGYLQGKLDVYPDLDRTVLCRDAENEYNALSRI